MIPIKVNNLNNICSKYTAKIHEALQKRALNISDVKTLLNKTEDINSDDFGTLHFKTIISIISLTSISISADSTTENLCKSLNDNRLVLEVDVSALEIKVKEILKQIIDDKLVEAEPKRMKKLNTGFKIKSFDEKIRKYFFNYNNYRSILDNYIAKPLGVKVCPYCNRNFISLVPQDGDETSEEKVIGPTYDHFFHKKEYPFLSLSFYNLVPSCYVCNSNLKGEKGFDYKKNINPYLEGFGEDVFFDFELESDLISKKVRFVPKLKANEGIKDDKQLKVFGDGKKNDSGNANVFKLNEIYETHSDTVEDVYQNFDETSRYYVNSIKTELSKLGASEAEYYRFHFKNYYDEVDFNKRPLSKLTKDIYKKMKDIAIMNR